MFVRQIALVSETPHITASQLTRVGAALQKQASRDFGPLWGIQATVDSFVSLDDVPLGYWPVIVRDDIGDSSAAGFHQDENGQPFALVEYSRQWSLTASHETLEMLADPFGNRLIAGDSVKPGQGRVEYLVEVCDPSEAASFAYRVNGVLVSDFYTPRFFDPIASSGVQYSFTGAIKKPRQVLKGGYLSWHDPITDHWYQEVFFRNAPEFRDLGALGSLKGGIRSTIDRLTQQEQEKVLRETSSQRYADEKKESVGVGVLTAAAAQPETLLVSQEQVLEATASRGKKLQETIAALLAEKKPSD